MDFIDKINELSARIKKQAEHVQTEEATKNAFVLPFIQALGYDVFNPQEVIPEFTADIGTKKGEKVDYAIRKDNQIIMIIECKTCGCDLRNENFSQLSRYFSVVDARFGILTNGIQYRFFTDIKKSNIMDPTPFLVFDFQELERSKLENYKIEELKKFTKPAFNLESIIASASELMYLNAIKNIFTEMEREPSQEFVKFFASRVYSGNFTLNAYEQFLPIVKKAFTNFIREKIADSFIQAQAYNEKEIPEQSAQECETPQVDSNGIITTEEEIEGYNIVKAIAREVVDVHRITLRDNKSYCSILLDNNNRKPICRLHLNGNKKYITLFNDKMDEKISIDSIDDLFKHASKIKSTALGYDETNKTQGLTPPLTEETKFPS